MRAAELRYYRNLGCLLTSNAIGARKWWDIAKRACGLTSKRKMPSLLVNDAVLTSPLDKATVINMVFQQQCSSAPPADAVSPGAPLNGLPVFSFQPVTVDDFTAELRKLQSRKSVGQDGVPNELLKLSCLQIAQHLATLFNRSLSEGVFPRSWKDAILAPQLKDGKDAALPISYRPIALLSNISKVFERLVHKQLVTDCLTNGILPDEQFGFLKGRSAEWQLLYLLQRWHEALDKKRCVHAVFLDAAKAFDRVDHSMLLSKLCGIGLDGPALYWLRSYLSDRRIMSRVDDAVSDPLHITSGVPQGSVLGPLLFIIYFKDIPSVTQACSALFADDTLLFRDDRQGANGCCSLSSDLSDISTWAAQSNVSFNATKPAGALPWEYSIIGCLVP